MARILLNVDEALVSGVFELARELWAHVSVGGFAPWPSFGYFAVDFWRNLLSK